MADTDLVKQLQDRLDLAIAKIQELIKLNEELLKRNEELIRRYS